jgi:membrane fusion protein, heavy metal efflux system
MTIGLVAGTLIITGCGQPKTDGEIAKSEGHDHSLDTQLTAAPHHHELAGETCFICDASKRDQGRLWCKEHDRYEDRCWLCHPELEDKSRLWCREHSLYEDECFL